MFLEYDMMAEKKFGGDFGSMDLEVDIGNTICWATPMEVI